MCEEVKNEEVKNEEVKEEVQNEEVKTDEYRESAEGASDVDSSEAVGKDAEVADEFVVTDEMIAEFAAYFNLDAEANKESIVGGIVDWMNGRGHEDAKLMESPTFAFVREQWLAKQPKQEVAE